MPKRKRTSTSRRSFKKRRMSRKKFYKKSSRLVRQPRVIADSQMVKLRYVDYVTLDPATATPAFDTWSATSCFDPYVGVGGHQPLGFDEWMTFYNHFQVMGAKCTAYMNAFSGNPQDNYWFVAQTSASSGAPANNINQYIEQKRSNFTFVTALGGSKNIGKVTATYSPKKFFNLKNPRDEHDLRGSITGSPAENAYFQIIVGASNPSDNPAATNVRVVIDYIVLLTERKHLGQS